VSLDSATMTALITGGSSVMAAGLGFLGNRMHKGLKTTQEVRDQVSNGHQTNLRDDIDRIIDGQEKLLKGQAEHTAQIADLQADLSWERRERLDLARIVHGGQTPLG